MSSKRLSKAEFKQMQQINADKQSSLKSAFSQRLQERAKEKPVSDIEPNEELLAAMRAVQPEGVPVAYIIGHIQHLLNDELQKVDASDVSMIAHRTREIELLEEVATKIENGEVY